MRQGLTSFWRKLTIITPNYNLERLWHFSMKNHPLNWILNISHSDITLYYRYKLLLLKNVSPSCCSQLLSTGVIYSMANPDAMNAYLPPGKVLVLRSARRPAEHLQLLCHWQGLSGQFLRSPAPSKGQNHTVIYLTRDGMKGASGGKEGHNAVKEIVSTIQSQILMRSVRKQL